MSHSKSYEFLLKDISTLNRVGQKTKKILKQEVTEGKKDGRTRKQEKNFKRNMVNIGLAGIQIWVTMS